MTPPKVNGGLVWTLRVLVTVLAATLTVIAALSLKTMNDLSSSVSAMRGDIASVRSEISNVREQIAGQYITRDEARVLVQALDDRLNERMDRELSVPPTLEGSRP